MKHLLTAALLAWSLTLQASPRESEAIVVPRLSPQQAIETSAAFLEKRGVPLGRLVSVTFDHLTGEWWLMYESIGGGLGKHYSVRLDNAPDAHAEFVGGL